MGSGGSRGGPAAASGSYQLGRFDVARVGFGAMQLPRLGRNGATRLLRRAVDLGVNHIDTAAYYGSMTANTYIRAALHPYPAHLAIASKTGYRLSESGGLVPAQRPAQLRAGVENDLRSLGTERIGVVNLRLDELGHHNQPGRVALDDQLAAMTAMREEGLIASFGISNAGLADMLRALDAGAVCVQNSYSLFNRTDEPLLRVCLDRGIAWVPYFPLGGARMPKDSGAYGSSLADIARRYGTSPAQIALAWLLSHAPNVVLIAGTSDLGHLEANLASASIRLDAKSLATLDAL